jgi:hypothetical protein
MLYNSVVYRSTVHSSALIFARTSTYEHTYLIPLWLCTVKHSGLGFLKEVSKRINLDTTEGICIGPREQIQIPMNFSSSFYCMHFQACVLIYLQLKLHNLVSSKLHITRGGHSQLCMCSSTTMNTLCYVCYSLLLPVIHAPNQSL